MGSFYTKNRCGGNEELKLVEGLGFTRLRIAAAQQHRPTKDGGGN
jgi:hypothetical protein